MVGANNHSLLLPGPASLVLSGLNSLREEEERENGR